MRNRTKPARPNKNEYRLTVVLTRQEGDAWAAYLDRKGAKKSTYARRLILDDMARAEARA